MIFLIIGRSGVGKDTLAGELVKHGLRQVKSYTTRPKRTPDENTHIFVTPEEAEKITDRVAQTEISGYEYFATAAQVERADIYIIDPKGAYELMSKMPDERFVLLYVSADAEAAANAAVKRSDNPKEMTVFNKRRKAENAQFKEFESRFNGRKPIGRNSSFRLEVKNTFEEGCFAEYVDAILKLNYKWKKIRYIIGQLRSKAPECLKFRGDRIGCYTDKGLEYISEDAFIERVIADDTCEGLGRLYDCYLDTANVSLKVPVPAEKIEKSHWGEVRCDYIDPKDGFWRVDAWKTDDDSEEGEVIALIDELTCRIVYLDPLAKTDLYAQEVINERAGTIKKQVWVERDKSSALTTLHLKTAMGELIAEAEPDEATGSGDDGIYIGLKSSDDPYMYSDLVGVRADSDGVRIYTFEDIHDENWQTKKEIKASEIRSLIETEKSPDILQPMILNHRHSLWYGGRVAELEYKGYRFILGAYGDVIGTLTDECGNEIAEVRDKCNAGGFKEQFGRFISGDDQLRKLLNWDHLTLNGHEIFLNLENNNWWEVLIDTPDGRQLDLGWVCNSDYYDEALEEMRAEMKSVVAKDLWSEFGDVPMDPATECIVTGWKHFPAGTHREEIWHWFEDEFGVSVAKDLM